MKGWAIKNNRGQIYLGTIQEDKEDCIDEYFERYKIGKEERDRRWNERQKEGYSCVELEIKLKED